MGPPAVALRPRSDADQIRTAAPRLSEFATTQGCNRDAELGDRRLYWRRGRGNKQMRPWPGAAAIRR